jgi:putative glutamine amidotransferase
MAAPTFASGPLVGITTDLLTPPPDGPVRLAVGLGYARAVADAGGIPVLLAAIPGLEAEYARRCDAFVFTGGDDPRTEPFGVPTHPRATPMHPQRQEFETRLLEVLRDAAADKPVLGVCLGMQMMALVSGGVLDQHMPDSRPDAGRHWGREHAIVPFRDESSVGTVARIVAGLAHSRHRQAVMDAGRLSVRAISDDGVIEAVADPARAFYLGVQWHPERTDDPNLGRELFRRLVAAARGDVTDPAPPRRR